VYKVIVVRVMYENEEDAASKLYGSAVVEKEFAFTAVPPMK